MPPSPALRCSPGRELPGNKHRRGHSIEYGILFRDKDEDLTLFNELQDKERDDFLLHSSDDLEDVFCKSIKIVSVISLNILLHSNFLGILSCSYKVEALFRVQHSCSRRE